MSTIRSNYSNNHGVTITLNSLADGSFAVSSAIDNSAAKFITADVQLKFRTTTGTTSIGIVQMFLIRSLDGGTTYDDTTSAELIGSFNANSDNTTFIVSTDTGFNGQLPDFFKFAVKNLSGAVFDSTGSNFTMNFLGKRFEIV